MEDFRSQMANVNLMWYDFEPDGCGSGWPSQEESIQVSTPGNEEGASTFNNP